VPPLIVPGVDFQVRRTCSGTCPLSVPTHALTRAYLCKAYMLRFLRSSYTLSTSPTVQYEFVWLRKPGYHISSKHCLHPYQYGLGLKLLSPCCWLLLLSPYHPHAHLDTLPPHISPSHSPFCMGQGPGPSRGHLAHPGPWKTIGGAYREQASPP
jgi:hypothetical protein